MVQRSTVFIWTSWSCCGTRSKTAAREGASFSDICLVVLEQRSFYSYFVRLRSSHCKPVHLVNVWFLLQTSTSADSGAVWCLCLNNSKTQLAVSTEFLRVYVDLKCSNLCFGPHEYILLPFLHRLVPKTAV